VRGFVLGTVEPRALLAAWHVHQISQNVVANQSNHLLALYVVASQNVGAVLEPCILSISGEKGAAGGRPLRGSWAWDGPAPLAPG
jgi:hypothetical protein